MNLFLGFIAFILGAALLLINAAKGQWIVLPFSFGLMYLGMMMMFKSKHVK